MTGAELKCIRQRLGISVRHMCDRLGISMASERKLRRWESGREAVPAWIAAKAEKLETIGETP